MPHSPVRAGWIVCAFLWLTLGCSDDDAARSDALPSESSSDAGVQSDASASMSCSADEDCSALGSPCQPSECDESSRSCVPGKPADEGTACGTNAVCDNEGRCLKCGTDADSTYALIQANIYDSTKHGCNDSNCHGRSPGQASLDLSASKSYEHTVGVSSSLSSMLRIAPDDPEQSFLYRKLAWATNGEKVEGGTPMPAGGLPPVPEPMLAGLRAWIEQGAPADGFVDGTVAQLCEPPCTSDEQCSNGDPCDGEERCEEGACVPGQKAECNSDDRLSERWTFTASGGVMGQPLVVGERVFTAARGGNVYALDRKTGELIWKHETGARSIEGGPTLASDDSFVIGDSNATVWRFTFDGEVVWESSLQETGVDHIWSSVTPYDGMVYVGIASHADTPCTKGRTQAIDLETGEKRWARYNVPKHGVCHHDTSIECMTADDCGGETCEDAIGGAVTASVLAEDGAVYVNTVGCYTFPQIGDTDAMMKLDAKTGEVIWKRLFSETEQFGKMYYYDFGFISYPLLIDAPDGEGGTRRLLINGDKSGALYAVHADTGELVWMNQVTPRAMGDEEFAAFGLFNGGLAYGDGLLFAALNEPAVASDEPLDHLMAFSPVDGSIVWSDDIGPSWADVTYHDGVVFTGTNGAPLLFAYDAESGTRLAEYELPGPVTGNATIHEGMLFIGFGLSDMGGLRAYEMK